MFAEVIVQIKVANFLRHGVSSKRPSRQIMQNGRIKYADQRPVFAAGCSPEWRITARKLCIKPTLMDEASLITTAVVPIRVPLIN